MCDGGLMRHSLIQGTQEWLDFRKGKIGASQVPIIMGVSPFMTRHQLWSEMVGISPPQQSNSAMERGSRLEETARICFESKIGQPFEPAVFSHSKYPWLICSLDGISTSHDKIVEIKCPNAKAHEEAGNGKAPDYYIPQMQMQMFITGLPFCHYFSFDGADGVVVFVQRDDEYIEKMVAKCNAFYELVLSYTPPDLEQKDYVDMSECGEWVTTELHYRHACEQLKEVEDIHKTLKKKLEILSEGKNVMGKYSRFTKVVTKGRIDYNEIKELKDVPLDQYRKAATTSFRITLKNE